MDFTSQGEKIYRPRPKAEVCKFSPRDVKSIDDRADVRQCYSHVRYYMNENDKPHLGHRQQLYQNVIYITKHFHFLVDGVNIFDICCSVITYRRACFLLTCLRLRTNQQPALPALNLPIDQSERRRASPLSFDWSAGRCQT